MSPPDRRAMLAIPDDWTPEQALAVHELLQQLTDTVWSRYDLAIIDLLAPNLDQNDTTQPDLFDFDDPCPF